ncbi:GNAT family N-acetyltransferase [Gemmobacter nectariphilus]|uniref:GNAT family N-acetyltransferase n=1 Tax=Gemmobacter nectariphilus TaxID=220343 RepID=UPI00041CC3B9|nr:GNAT family N-acetyltransferase [Gemmobacter nectariphilus]
MSQIIEEVRGPYCLASFRCGYRDIEKFGKKAYKVHHKALPECRVRVLYDGDDVLGFHSMSVKVPAAGEMIDTESVYAGDQTFLYLDHLAVHSNHQKKKHSTTLMVDVFAIAAETMNKFGRIFALSLNAANADAERFFKRWAFVSISDSSTPFMVLDRASVISTYEAIKAEAAASSASSAA